MSEQTAETDTLEYFENLITKDLGEGTPLALLEFVDMFHAKTTGTPWIFRAGKSSNQIEIGVGQDKHKMIRIIGFVDEEGYIQYGGISIWDVDKEGQDLYVHNNYWYFENSDAQKTSISRSITDGGVKGKPVNPDEFAASMIDALDILNEYNWQVIVGDNSPIDLAVNIF